MQSDKESSFFLHPPCLRVQSCHFKTDSYSFFKKALPFLCFYIAPGLSLCLILYLVDTNSNQSNTGQDRIRAYKNGHIVYLKHPAVWYTAEGGITALDLMLQDLETALLQN